MVKLSSAGLNWVRQSLLDGLSLGQEILRLHDPALGVAYAAVPRGFPVSGLEHPEWGQGMISRHRSDEALMELIGVATPRLVVVEDALMRPTDPIFESHASESFIFGMEVYHWRLCQQEDDYLSLGEFMTRWMSYPYNAMIIRSSRTYESGEEVAHEEIARLAMLTEGVAVGAFDNEGYIVWRPGIRPSPAVS